MRNKRNRSDTESHNDVNKSEGKHNLMIRLNNLFKKHTNKAEAPSATDAEDGRVTHDDEDNAAPSESTVIIDDEPQKKVKRSLCFPLVGQCNDPYLSSVAP